jgi:hypothetical protein
MRNRRKDWSGWDEHLEEDPAVIYAIDREFRLTRCNRAWDLFAIENGGDDLLRERQIGCSIVKVIAPSLRTFYLNAFDYVLQTGQEWTHVYQCACRTVYREFQMRIRPQRDGWLLIHSLICAREHGEAAFEGRLNRYMQAGGFVTMCAHCRRTKTIDEPYRWDWVPAFVETPPEQVSHGLCGPCLAYYYPEFEQANGPR